MIFMWQPLCKCGGEGGTHKYFGMKHPERIMFCNYSQRQLTGFFVSA
ncbi:hypothetical protein HMPREF0454_00232 [Hafnia alvei ATCC 51873]|uniref:Uncharacterized protein n=1 Tax=Hafnia alvei ATCC 51873 TaxID=1002364 RepID=G9Y117_HAFAL|nr:hypothetical protein HMPREF0454_00232 [Hafnia alvei ATCC 51873]